MATPVETVDMTPTPAGFETMAAMLLDSVMTRIPAKHKTVVAGQLYSVLDVMRYLASKPEEHARVRRILAHIEGSK